MATGDLYECAKRVQVHASGLTNMKNAPQDPPESSAAFPFAVSFPFEGTMSAISSGYWESHDIIVTEIHISRQNLPVDMQAIWPFVDSFPKAVKGDPTLDGNCQLVDSIGHSFGKLDYFQTETIGFRFTISLKRSGTL